MPNQHPGADLADDVDQWADEMSDYLAEAILGSPLSPATAKMPEAEKLRYFAAQFFTPDGQPNTQGRDALMAKYGPQGFEAIAKALAKKHAGLHEDVTGEPLPEPDRTVPVTSGLDPAVLMGGPHALA